MLASIAALIAVPIGASVGGGVPAAALAPLVWGIGCLVAVLAALRQERRAREIAPPVAPRTETEIELRDAA